MSRVVIHLPGERAPSWNVLYSGKHWARRKELKDAAYTVVSNALQHMTTTLYTVPVHITITACYKGALVDADNICAKLYVDALKGVVLQDDNPACVASVTTVSKRGKQPSVTIELREA